MGGQRDCREGPLGLGAPRKRGRGRREGGQFDDEDTLLNAGLSAYHSAQFTDLPALTHPVTNHFVWYVVRVVDASDVASTCT